MSAPMWINLHSHFQWCKSPVAFRFAYPGESGSRNPLRGDGYFSLDAGLGKSFPVTERISFRLRWDVFNVTNSVRFDTMSMSNRIDNPDSFGVYTRTLTDKRVMQTLSA
jgi:hypothetical protein